jgi:colanic acid/amylovoran biosynthesis glycosyltransferase
MKIAFLLPLFPAISETFILNQLTWLLDHGHHVDIFARKRSGERTVHKDVEKYRLLDRTYYYWDVPLNKIQRLVSAFRIIRKHVLKNPIGILRALNVIKYGKLAWTLGLLHRVGPFLSDYDIVQCHFGPSGNWAIFLKEFGIHAKVVTTFHGFDIRLGLEQGGHIYQRLFEKGDCFISISDYNFQSLCQLGLSKEKIVTLPIGIDLRKFPLKRTNPIWEPQTPCRIVTVARLVEEKGLRFGIEAVAQLKNIRPEVRIQYAIIGEGPLRGELESLVKKLNLEEVVSFRGPMEQKDIMQELLGSDLFLFPSIAEALPVSLMEAQAIGLPVVATQVGSADQIVSEGKSGFLVPSGNSALLAEKCAYLLEHPGEWEEMGRFGREIITQRYDINKLNNQLLALYQKLIS